MTPAEKANELYKDCYERWANELSHDKNVLIAKSIALYVCDNVLSDMGANRGYEFWSEVKQQIEEL